MNFQSIREEQANKDDPFCRLSIARGSDSDEDLICWVRARSKALIIIGSGQMAVSVLSDVSRRSCLESASAGAILVPRVTCHTILKSWRNKDHLACHQNSFQGSLT